METNQLDTAEFWDSDGIDVRLNPRLNYDSTGLAAFLSEERGFHSAVVVATSGSSGSAKFVVLKKTALLASAVMVNQWCDVTGADTWWGGLSTFHVGGLGIFARSVLTGSRVVVPDSMEWNRGAGYVEQLENAGVTLTSLTPVHLHDLVVSGSKAHKAMRGLFLGGGKISDRLVERAIDLGWPVWPTYGMSEAGSQIATSLTGDHKSLPVLPGWDARVGKDTGALEIRGEALFSGYATKHNGRWQFIDSSQRDDFFTTGDVVALENRQLRFLHRSDDLVKVLGELVSVSKVESAASEEGREVIVIPLPDARLETRLVAVLEGAAPEGADWIERINQKLARIEQLSEVRVVAAFPRTAIGKVNRKKLGLLF
ncbi:AMP-binding protein [Verrucomicrobiales bacterium]|jgi:o-succinylbenzoate---CoA ligase|nr:AMP-binding protein [Verrucomicrobiales bacterium]MDB4358873.1 AMP-binding protein [Verrucomicrobiales bacterium]